MRLDGTADRTASVCGGEPRPFGRDPSRFRSQLPVALGRRVWIVRRRSCDVTAGNFHLRGGGCGVAARGTRHAASKKLLRPQRAHHDKLIRTKVRRAGNHQYPLTPQS